MRTLCIAMMLSVCLLCGGSLAHGQQATERFIPIGRSPGASGTRTAIGPITAVEPEARRIRLATSTGPVTVEIASSTRIWIDRHELGLTTETGSFEDCREGRVAEVKLAQPAAGGVAEWVKIQTPDPAP